MYERRIRVSKSKNIDLTEGSIAKQMIAFAIPLFLGNLFQQMYNMADSLIVGNSLGSEALAAVASTGALTFLLVGFFSGTAMGAGVVISKFFGARDYDNLRLAIHTDVAFGIVAGLILTVLGVAFTPQILLWMGTPADVFPNAVLYLRVYFLGSLAVLLYNICMGILQAVGDSKHPLYYLILSSIVNIVLDLIFCGVFKLGVEYAALATIISQFLSVVLCMSRLMRVQDVYQVRLREVKLHPDMLKQILAMGLPTGLQNSVISLANVVVQSNINAFGKMAMAGCGAYSKVEGFAFLPVTCFTMALTTFVGQNMGAQKYDRVKKGVVFGIVCTIILSELTGFVINGFAPQLIALFDSEPQVVAFGVQQAGIATWFFFLMAFSHASAAVMRGAGKPVVPMVVILTAWCVIRIIYITIATSFIHDIRVVFWAYPITWSISSTIFLIYLLRGNWLPKKKAEKGFSSCN
ncbi:MAG: MATE family efflux transporter [Lachnospiraceae bacterium]|nr:MATE family efflux transporter [Lachnospiraceae bacterium]